MTPEKAREAARFMLRALDGYAGEQWDLPPALFAVAELRLAEATVLHPHSMSGFACACVHGGPDGGGLEVHHVLHGLANSIEKDNAPPPAALWGYVLYVETETKPGQEDPPREARCIFAISPASGLVCVTRERGSDELRDGTWTKGNLIDALQRLCDVTFRHKAAQQAHKN